MIEHPAYPVEPWAVRETELHLDKLAQSESVFALSNGHIGLRGNLDEGEPYGLPGTYLAGPVRDPSAAVRRGRLRLSRRRPVGRQRHQRQAASGCWSRTSRSTSATASSRATSACSISAPGVLRRSVVWTSPTGRQVQDQLDPAGLVHPAGGGRDRVRGRAGRRRVPGRTAVRAGRQRDDAGRLQGPARGGSAGRAAAFPRTTTNRRPARGAGAPHQGQRAADGVGDRSPRRRARRHRDDDQRLSRRRPDRGRREPRARQAAADHQGDRLRLVGDALGPGAARPGLSRAGRRAAHRLRGSAGRAARTIWTTTGIAPTSRSKATPSCSRRSASRCGTRCRPAPAASSARSPPRG